MNEARVGTLDGGPALGAVRQRGALASGVVSGLLGGAAMAVFMVLAASVAGMPRFHALDVVGAAFFEPEALDGAAQVAFGAAVHLLVSAAAGLAFAAVVPRDLSPSCAAVVGVGYALFLAGIMASLVLPVANPAFRDGMQPLGGSWVIAHALFGTALGLTFAFAGRATRGQATAG